MDAATILDGGGSGSVITVTGSAVAEIIGFTIQNGGGTSFKGKSVGGGVYVDQGTDVTIRDGRIVNNFAQIGAGLSTTFAKSSPFSANIALHDTEISYNVASLGAGAIYSFANMVLDNCEVAFNTASIAAGVAAVGFKGTSVTVDATGTVIHGNETSKLAGGGLYLGSDVTWTGGEVFENAAYEGAGLFVESSGGGPTVVQDVRIYENYASANGAGAYANAPLELIDTVFEANIAGGDGGGLYVDSPTTMTGGALLLNGAARGGGAYIYTSLTATSVDMGADATDNTPQDVMVRNGTPWNWDGVASFTCADASCL